MITRILKRHCRAPCRPIRWPLTCPSRQHLKRLPKTRSGKILRAVLRKIADGQDYVPPSTLDDPAVLGEIEALLADSGREWEYAHSVARRMFKVGRLEWCNPDQLAKVIAALQIDADRRKRRETA